jgi:phosphohistidine phosphatase
MSLKILVIRHGIAEERGKGQGPEEDWHRALTDEGRKKMRRAAKGLANVVKCIDVLGSSPLDRALQTAEIVGEVFGVKTSVAAGLVPGNGPGEVLKWVQQQTAEKKSSDERDVPIVAVVGHEPGLGVLVSWMLSGLNESFVELKKGAACLVEFDGQVKAGHGRLVWSLRPRELRKIGKKECG